MKEAQRCPRSDKRKQATSEINRMEGGGGTERIYLIGGLPNVGYTSRLEQQLCMPERGDHTGLRSPVNSAQVDTMFVILVLFWLCKHKHNEGEGEWKARGSSRLPGAG